ncbi:MAG TPA: 50S ribosomal protein L25 [Thermoanaerobaculia bacterium]|nr:50S ribosomal protein L25 [Thermoanaerobaculia bacterium]
MAETTIEVQRREGAGKSHSRRLRGAGMIPAILYGAGKESVPIQVPRKTLLELFKSGGHENRIFLLKLSGTDQSRHAMVRDLQIDPVTAQVVHLDFQRIQLDEKIRVKVHVTLEGTPLGVKNEGGILDFVTRELEVECLPTAIPQEIKVAVAELHIGQHVEAGQLDLPEGVSYVGAPEAVIVSVKHSRVEAVPAEEAAEETVEAAEPEVIQKGKKEEAEES